MRELTYYEAESLQVMSQALLEAGERPDHVKARLTFYLVGQGWPHEEAEIQASDTLRCRNSQTHGDDK